MPRSRPFLLPICAAFLLAAPATHAAELTLDVTGAEKAERMKVRYRCAGMDPFEVEYVNAGPNTLAIVPVEGERLVFVTVMSGSGARYASGPWIWWTKGDTASLSSEMDGADAKPVECEEVAG